MKLRSELPQRRSGSEGRLSLGSFPFRGSRRRHVLVFERTCTRWKVIEAEIGGDSVTVLRAQIMERQPDGPPPDALSRFVELAKTAEVILLANSDMAVCRLLQLPDAPPDQTRRMVALRLETELPYPPAESLWVCERQRPIAAARPPRVLVMASPAPEIEQAEAELRQAGIRCRSVQFDFAALAELAATSAVAEQDTLAAVCVETRRTTLAVTRAGELCYVRRISTACDDDSTLSSRLPHLANELDQSIQDYLLRVDSSAPAHILVYGEQHLSEGLIEALKTRVELPVELATAPGILRISPDAAPEHPFTDFAACLGVAIAAHHRLHGRREVAPAVRRRRTALAEFRWRRRLVLIGANVVLLAAFIAGSFGVRAAKLESADRVVTEVQPYLADLEELEEEVSILQEERAKKRPMLDVLLALAEVMPNGVAIASLKVDSKDRITISGKTPNVELVSDKAVSAMEASPLFRNPDFLGTTREKDGLMFRMTCEVSKGALE